MSELKLFSMRAAYDDVMSKAIKRQHEPPQVVGDLLAAEIAEKQARSIKYQMAIAKLPLAKDLDDFDFAGGAVNELLVRDLARGGFVAEQRNIVLIGGTGTGKTHLTIAIARSCIVSVFSAPFTQGSESGLTRCCSEHECEVVLIPSCGFSS